MVSSLLATLVMPPWLALSGTLVLLLIATYKLFGVSELVERMMVHEATRPVSYRCGCGFASCHPATTRLHAQRAFHVEV